MTFLGGECFAFYVFQCCKTPFHSWNVFCLDYVVQTCYSKHMNFVLFSKFCFASLILFCFPNFVLFLLFSSNTGIFTTRRRPRCVFSSAPPTCRSTMKWFRIYSNPSAPTCRFAKTRNAGCLWKASASGWCARRQKFMVPSRHIKPIKHIRHIKHDTHISNTSNTHQTNIKHNKHIKHTSNRSNTSLSEWVVCSPAEIYGKPQNSCLSPIFWYPFTSLVYLVPPLVLNLSLSLSLSLFLSLSLSLILVFLFA